MSKRLFFIWLLLLLGYSNRNEFSYEKKKTKIARIFAVYAVYRVEDSIALLFRFVFGMWLLKRFMDFVLKGLLPHSPCKEEKSRRSKHSFNTGQTRWKLIWGAPKWYQNILTQPFGLAFPLWFYTSNVLGVLFSHTLHLSCFFSKWDFVFFYKKKLNRTINKTDHLAKTATATLLFYI